jgi:hypothetical protein
MTTTMTEPHYVYAFDEFGEAHAAQVYDFVYNERQYRLVFKADDPLMIKCGGVYTITGQSGVYDFLNQFYGDEIEWAYCKGCDCESPYELSATFGPRSEWGEVSTAAECLVCTELFVVSYDQECALCGYSIRFDGNVEGKDMYINQGGARTCDMRDENAPAHVPF